MEERLLPQLCDNVKNAMLAAETAPARGLGEPVDVGKMLTSAKDRIVDIFKEHPVPAYLAAAGLLAGGYKLMAGGEKEKLRMEYANPDVLMAHLRSQVIEQKARERARRKAFLLGGGILGGGLAYRYRHKLLPIIKQFVERMKRGWERIPTEPQGV